LENFEKQKKYGIFLQNTPLMFTTRRIIAKYCKEARGLGCSWQGTEPRARPAGKICKKFIERKIKVNR
jgi:hypothetical protein